MGRCSLSQRPCPDLVGLRRLAAMEEHVQTTTTTTTMVILGISTDGDLEAGVEVVGGSRCTQAASCQARSH